MIPLMHVNVVTSHTAIIVGSLYVGHCSNMYISNHIIYILHKPTWIGQSTLGTNNDRYRTNIITHRRK